MLGPTVSIGRDGNVVLNFGTGDTNYIGTATNPNYAYSLTELPNTTAQRLMANLNWYLPFPTNGEMMTGPAAVFDSGYYFATYRPPSTTGSCASGGAYLWGVDFTLPASATGAIQSGTGTPVISNGGVYKMAGSSGLVPNVSSGTAIIPGVTITSTLACATATASTDTTTGGPLISMSGATPAQYELSALQGTPGSTTAGSAAVSQVNIAVSVHASTLIDSWAAIVE